MKTGLGLVLERGRMAVGPGGSPAEVAPVDGDAFVDLQDFTLVTRDWCFAGVPAEPADKKTAPYAEWIEETRNRRSRLGTRQVELQLPAWIEDHIGEPHKGLGSIEARMRLVIELSRANVEHGTGGPFAAAVFDADTGRILGVGVNLVETSNCSIAHAEVIAIATAQQAVGHYDLSRGQAVRELVTSTEPCAMCLGAIPWSGVRRVVCGARGQNACEIGFDEGAKPADWVGELHKRGIEVIRDILREEARAVLQQYARSSGLIYNARRP